MDKSDGFKKKARVLSASFSEVTLCESNSLYKRTWDLIEKFVYTDNCFITFLKYSNQYFGTLK